MIPLVHRLRLLVARHGDRVAIALAVLGVVAVGAGLWVVANPPTQQVTERVDVQTIRTEVDTAAYVAGENSFWDQGTWLENGTIYPVEDAPELRLEVRTDVPPDRAVAVNHSVAVVYRATRGETTFWRERDRIATEETTTSDGTAETTVVVDVGGVRSKVRRLDEQLTGLGQVGASLRLSVEYATGRYEGSFARSTPLSFAGGGYWLGGALTGEKQHARTVVREVPAAPNRSLAGGLVLIGLGGLAAAWALHRHDLGDVERRAAAAQLERSRYSEWVSTGRLRQAISGQDVQMESLKDLVDLAIDAKLRVVHDPERDLYAVISEGVIYYYDTAGPREVDERSIVDPPREPGISVTGDGGRTDTRGGVDPATGDVGDGPARAPGTEESSPEADAEDDPDHDPWNRLLEDWR